MPPSNDPALRIRRVQAVFTAIENIQNTGLRRLLPKRVPITAAHFIAICDAFGLAVEVALAQGWDESHLGLDAGRPQQTRNIWNVGNVDSGANRHMGTWEDGMRAYCSLLSRRYGTSAEVLIDRRFTRSDGAKYATDPQYVQKFVTLLNRVRTIMAAVQ